MIRKRRVILQEGEKYDRKESINRRGKNSPTEKSRNTIGRVVWQRVEGRHNTRGNNGGIIWGRGKS